MRNTEIRSFNTDSDALAVLLTDAKKEEGMSGTEAAELLRREATRFENESQELH